MHTYIFSNNCKMNTLNYVLGILGVAIGILTIVAATNSLGQQQPITVAYASSNTEDNNNPVVKTETKNIEGQMYRVETFADGQQKMTKLGTGSGAGSCAYINPEAGTTYGSKDCDPKAPLKPGSGVIMSSPDDKVYDLPPYGEGGLVDPDDLPVEEGNNNE
jgi:hypothetical protein